MVKIYVKALSVTIIIPSMSRVENDEDFCDIVIKNAET